MPADPRRKIVNTRLLPEQIRKLDRLVAQRTEKRGRVVSRSRLLAELIEEEHAREKPRLPRPVHAEA